MRPEYDPTKLVDEWPLPGLCAADRKRIKAHLLSANAVHTRGNPADFPRRFIVPIQQAFDGIARVLFDARLLSFEILNKQLPLFLLESAIAAGWLHFPKPTVLAEVSAEFFEGYPDIFSAETDEWAGKLLEREAGESKNVEWSQQDSMSGDKEEQSVQLATLEEEVKRRAKLLSEYKQATKNPSNRQIYEAHNSPIHKPQFHKWVKGTLLSGSSTAANFERFLRDKKPPIPKRE